jgi:hypothetical protein
MTTGAAALSCPQSCGNQKRTTLQRQNHRPKQPDQRKSSSQNMIPKLSGLADSTDPGELEHEHLLIRNATHTARMETTAASSPRLAGKEKSAGGLAPPIRAKQETTGE